ncbi:hypothetical protein VHEMI00894 [[Torrubiella] hemipterigena]|uniref:Uncharacterized protein n=1 Tax=[Torrubiella] hemipterigena TaxID=1531966 RepID=A0A0A1SRP5_9HYPO|nr:hypothetical protein VHEMI00894 [[Torrubiella] hemipterigena]
MTGSDSTGTSTPRANPDTADMTAADKHLKPKKRLFGFGKKKSSSGLSADEEPASTKVAPLTEDLSKLSTGSVPTTQTTHVDSSLNSPSTPSRALSASPRIVSPAGSQIFERDVQESTLTPASPAIPTHIQTENYIPSVLDDASEAITNDNLDPDAVEIVTHTSHQPASVTVTGAGANQPAGEQSSTEWAEELASFANRIGLPADSASNYGSLDSGDVRRLSFISFADVVQSEHTATSPVARDNMHLVGLTSLPSSRMNRSPSPLRSPVSSQGPGTSPPTSNPGSIKGLDLSPTRKHLNSPGHLNIGSGSDLNIETMRQALRRTGSRDMSTVRSTPASPIDGPGSR